MTSSNIFCLINRLNTLGEMNSSLNNSTAEIDRTQGYTSTGTYTKHLLQKETRVSRNSFIELEIKLPFLGQLILISVPSVFMKIIK